MDNKECLNAIIKAETNRVASLKKISLLESEKPSEPIKPVFHEPELITIEEPHVNAMDWILLYFCTGLIVGIVAVLLSAISYVVPVPTYLFYVPLWLLWLASFFIKPFREKFKEKVLAWKCSRPEVVGERLAAEKQNQVRRQQAQESYDAGVEAYNRAIAEYPKKLASWRDQLAKVKEVEQKNILTEESALNNLLTSIEFGVDDLDISALQSLLSIQEVDSLTPKELNNEYQRICRMRNLSSKADASQREQYAEQKKIQRLQAECEEKEAARSAQNAKRALKVAGYAALGVAGGAIRKEKHREKAIDKAYSDAEAQTWIDEAVVSTHTKDKHQEAEKRKAARELKLQQDIERAKRM